MSACVSWVWEPQASVWSDTERSGAAGRSWEQTNWRSVDRSASSSKRALAIDSSSMLASSPLRVQMWGVRRGAQDVAGQARQHVARGATGLGGPTRVKVAPRGEMWRRGASVRESASLHERDGGRCPEQTHRCDAERPLREGGVGGARRVATPPPHEGHEDPARGVCPLEVAAETAAVARRSHGGYMVVTWRLHGGYATVALRSHGGRAQSTPLMSTGGYVAVAWRPRGGRVAHASLSECW